MDDSAERKIKLMNAHATAVSDDDFEPEMDLDDQSTSVDDWDKMETEEADNGLKYQDLIDETVRYGQELRFEFREDRSKHIEDSFKDIFSMFAYPDPRKSPTSHLLDPSGRVPVAEELNSAILGMIFPPLLSTLLKSPGNLSLTHPSITRQILLRRHRAPLSTNRGSRQRNQRSRRSRNTDQCAKGFPTAKIKPPLSKLPNVISSSFPRDSA